jgi:hypothetical protein
MKKNILILIIASILYLSICLSFSTDYFQDFSRLEKENISLDGDYTNVFNEKFMKAHITLYNDSLIKDLYSNYTQINLTNIFNLKSDYYSFSRTKKGGHIIIEPEIYIFPVQDVKEMIKKYKISNPKNIDYSKTKYVFPFGNEKSENQLYIFQKEKNIGKKISTDINGNPVYDSSIDCVILYTIDKEIRGYVYIDSRLVDARKLLLSPQLSKEKVLFGSLIDLKELKDKSDIKNGNVYYFDWLPDKEIENIY